MKNLTPQEKKELDFITNQAVKVAIAIGILFFALIILSTLI
jgi:hypothetical protein